MRADAAGGYVSKVGEDSIVVCEFFFSSRRRHTRLQGDWSSDVCSSDLILVLDDALSSVDTQTEDKILNHLREVMQGRTTIFISHRVSTVRNADHIAVLHSGRIVEFGTHEDLISKNGYYSDLYNKQLLEEELAEVS